MMQLFLARHMFMHSFHAYIPFLFFLSFLYFDCIFCFSLSLSLSLSLSDRLRMAPKRKSTPSRNPLHFGTSSSDPTPTHIRFRDGKAH